MVGKRGAMRLRDAQPSGIGSRVRTAGVAAALAVGLSGITLAPAAVAATTSGQAQVIKAPGFNAGGPGPPIKATPSSGWRVNSDKLKTRDKCSGSGPTLS
jgi:hypothetical protein